MKDIYVNNQNFYKKIKKYIKNKKCKIHFLYQDYDIVDDSFLENHKLNKDIMDMIYITHAINIKDKKERYSYIYDQVCKFLDKEFQVNNICRFEDNLCIGVRSHCHCQSEYGCCYGRKRGLCKNLVDNHCTIQSISCKLFVCNCLKKEKIEYKVNDLVLLKYFFNPIQKYYIEYSLFKDKSEMIPLLLKYTRK